MKISRKLSKTNGMRHPGRLRKCRKTFSLSINTVKFLESFRKDKAAASLTAALEAILLERKRQDELNNLSADVAAHYNSFSPKDRHQENTWGKFAESQWTDLDR